MSLLERVRIKKRDRTGYPVLPHCMFLLYYKN